MTLSSRSPAFLSSFLIIAFLQCGLASPVEQTSISEESQRRNCWMSPDGAGRKDGTDRDNAYGAKQAQKCWDETGSKGTMYVLPGHYSKKEKTFWNLEIDDESSGRNAEGLKRLIGIGNVRVSGSRPTPYKQSQASRGEIWIHLQKNAKNIAIENFTIEKVSRGVLADQGGNQNLYLYGLDFADTRQNIQIYGHPRCGTLSECRVIDEELSSHVVISHVSGIRYSKRHIRLGKGIHHVDVIFSKADSENLDGDFAVGFDVEGPAHDILFYGSNSSRNRYTISEYWNGDGFKAERETFSIQWIGCEAYDNADGGFDIKTKGALLRDIVAVRNKRNIRIWNSEGAVLENVYAADSKNWGGVGADAGVWAQGILECRFCTVKGNAIQALIEGEDKKAEIVFYDSIVSTSGRRDSEIKYVEGKKASVKFVRTQVTKKAEKTGLVHAEQGREGYKKVEQISPLRFPAEATAGSSLYRMISELPELPRSTEKAG